MAATSRSPAPSRGHDRPLRRIASMEDFQKRLKEEAEAAPVRTRSSSILLFMRQMHDDSRTRLNIMQCGTSSTAVSTSSLSTSEVHSPYSPVASPSRPPSHSPTACSASPTPAPSRLHLVERPELSVDTAAPVVPAAPLNGSTQRPHDPSFPPWIVHSHISNGPTAAAVGSQNSATAVPELAEQSAAVSTTNNSPHLCSRKSHKYVICAAPARSPQSSACDADDDELPDDSPECMPVPHPVSQSASPVASIKLPRPSKQKRPVAEPVSTGCASCVVQ